MRLQGMEVVESVMMTEAGDPVTVRRTWRERLFSRPWRPLVATRTFRPQVPQKKLILIGGKWFGHPATVQAIKGSGLVSDREKGGVA